MSAAEREALELDDAIDAILRGEDGFDAGESGLAATARLLHDVLPRFHPRFGFEEALSARLSGIGAAGRSARSPIPFPVIDAAGRGGEDRSVWERYRRELVAGGAIASGVSIAIPLAGAALVRWRRSRSSSTPGGLF